MSSVPVLVSDDLVVSVGKRKVPLSPSGAFNLAERLIRTATRQIVVEEADRVAMLHHIEHAVPTLFAGMQGRDQTHSGCIHGLPP